MPENEGKGLYAVVRLKGSVRIHRRVRDALEDLRLGRKHSCTLVPADATRHGMLMHAEDFVAWGEINEDTLSRMIAKRGRSSEGGRIDEKKAKAVAKKIMREGTILSAGIDPVFRLSPPSGGLRSVRLQQPRGDLGNRGGKINDLLLRMI